VVEARIGELLSRSARGGEAKALIARWPGGASKRAALYGRAHRGHPHLGRGQEGMKAFLEKRKPIGSCEEVLIATAARSPCAWRALR